MAQCNLVCSYQSFRGMCWLIHQYWREWNRKGGWLCRETGYENASQSMGVANQKREWKKDWK